jgi:hypothetical protein
LSCIPPQVPPDGHSAATAAASAALEIRTLGEPPVAGTDASSHPGSVYTIDRPSGDQATVVGAEEFDHKRDLSDASRVTCPSLSVTTRRTGPRPPLRDERKPAPVRRPRRRRHRRVIDPQELLALASSKVEHHEATERGVCDGSPVRESRPVRRPCRQIAARYYVPAGAIAVHNLDVAMERAAFDITGVERDLPNLNLSGTARTRDRQSPSQATDRDDSCRSAYREPSHLRRQYSSTSQTRNAGSRRRAVS